MFLFICNIHLSADQYRRDLSHSGIVHTAAWPSVDKHREHGLSFSSWPAAVFLILLIG